MDRFSDAKEKSQVIKGEEMKPIIKVEGELHVMDDGNTGQGSETEQEDNSGQDLRKRWGVEEDKMLLKAKDEDGLAWKSIAKLLPNRTAGSLKSRYVYIKRSRKPKPLRQPKPSVAFTHTEDEQICRLWCNMVDDQDLVKHFPGKRPADVINRRVRLSNDGKDGGPTELMRRVMAETSGGK